MTIISQTVPIDIVSDVMCPWCYIGKRNLEAARSLLGDTEISVHWRPYQLDPTLPTQGKDRKQYLSEKFGGDERASEIYSRVRKAGQEAGIDFNFDAIEVAPNTLNAHRLIRWAGGQAEDLQDKVVTRLFELYFEEGANLADIDVLADAGASAGMDRNLLLELFQGDADRESVEREIQSARQMGVTGVPCFIVGQRYAVMGAQPPEAIAQAVRQAAAENAEAAAYTND